MNSYLPDLITPLKDIKEALRRDFKQRRLLEEDEGVIGVNRLSPSSDGRWHRHANYFWVFLAVVLPPIYMFLTSEISTTIFNFLVPAWKLERAYAPKAFLHVPTRIDGSRGLFDPCQAHPRWLIKVTYEDNHAQRGRRRICLIAWKEEEVAIKTKGYTALSYSYTNAKELFHEAYPGVPINEVPPKPYSPTDPRVIIDDPLLTAWKQRGSNAKEKEDWRKVALRQRFARVFLDHYLDSNHRPGQTEYIWLDEFCLYDGSEPILKDREEELGRMADIFSQAAAVCIYCPRNGCNHANQECEWGNRLWTLSEILHTNKVVTMTRWRRGDEDPWEYELIERDGRYFRANMQHEAEIMESWHLAAIMRHANNGGSMTWQHSIHALLVEAIRRNGVTNQKSKKPNSHLAKALNGLLPRRANPKDLTAKDGWADLAWLLEINQGFYNAATLAAVCGLGETKVQGHGWLGPPMKPSAGNERLHPLVTAFPIKEGLLLMGPNIIGLRKELKRDLCGVYNNEKLRALRTIVIRLPLVTLLFVAITSGVIPYKDSRGPLVWVLIWTWFGLAITSVLRLITSTMYVEKGGIILLREKTLRGQSAEEYLGNRDRELKRLEQWGDEQLAPQWTTGIESESEEVTLVDLMSRIQSRFIVRNWEGKEPNALVPIAVHGCGVTCLVLHHHDDPLVPAVKLGIVNMPPYILALGEKVGSIVVGAVPEEVKEVPTFNPYLPTIIQGHLSVPGSRQRYATETTAAERSPYGSRTGFTQPAADSYLPSPGSERSPYGSRTGFMQPAANNYLPSPGSEQRWTPHGSRMALVHPTYPPTNNPSYDRFYGPNRV